MTEIKVLNTRKVAMTFIVWDEECRLLISQVIVQHPVWFKLHSKQHRNLRMYFNSELLSVKANNNIPLYCLHTSKWKSTTLLYGWRALLHPSALQDTTT